MTVDQSSNAHRAKIDERNRLTDPREPPSIRNSVKARTEMCPVTLNGNFGWLHTTTSNIGSNVAVLLCSGLNRDALDSHQALRVLADEIAAAGYPAMRFDYPGIGDSCDIETAGADSVEHWAAWQKSVHSSADWLRRTTGASRLIFCGLRVGAAIAVTAAERRDDVVGIVLLEPVLRGRSYILQLATEAKLQGQVDTTLKDGLSFQELQFSAETVSWFRQVDLRQNRLPVGCKVSVFSRTASRVLSACTEAWAQQGAEVTCFDFSGMEPMLQHNLLVSVVSLDFSKLLDWLLLVVPVEQVYQPTALIANPELSRPGWIEVPLRFGINDGLFGMLCRPDCSLTKSVVIICNTGRDPHYGFARSAVKLSRCLALSGIASLRMDFAGLGDSVSPTGEVGKLSSMFETSRTADISAAVDILNQMGYRHYTLQGLCAGAYHAFHAALKDSRIGTVILLNMPVFTWRAGDTVDFSILRLSRPSHFLKRMGSLRAWSKLFEGKVEVRAILCAQAARLLDHVQRSCGQLVKQCGYAGSPSFALQAMEYLTLNGVKVVCLFSPDDRGIDLFREEFGSFNALQRKFEDLILRIVPDIDHYVSTPKMQGVLAEIVIGHMTDNTENL